MQIAMKSAAAKLTSQQYKYFMFKTVIFLQFPLPQEVSGASRGSSSEDHK